MDGVPFEELDACCQKEVLLQRREKEFKERIKRYDRADHRKNLQKSVFSTIQTLQSRCHCCQNSGDYPLLTTLRPTHGSGHEEVVGEEESDDEFDLGDYKSPSELWRIEQVKTLMVQRENLQTLGFSAHMRESAQHLIETIENFRVPIVLHIYFPDQRVSAYLDLALEHLSSKYLGTLFRRVLITDCGPLLAHFDLDPPSSPLLLAVDSSGTLVDVCSSFSSFHSGLSYLWPHFLIFRLDDRRQ
jgi:hypothetical protein